MGDDWCTNGLQAVAVYLRHLELLHVGSSQNSQGSPDEKAAAIDRVTMT